MTTGKVDYGFGVDQASGGTLWASAAGSTSQHRWYCATTQVMNVNTTGLQMPAGSTIEAANITVSGNLTVSGTITNTSINASPFWIAGRVSALGSVTSRNLGRFNFTATKSATGFYTIYPDELKPFPDALYIVLITVMSDANPPSYRIPQSYFQTTSFNVYTYISGVQADAAFMVTVIAD
jgi:hypothetical protein